jgi:hypothetical protein
VTAAVCEPVATMSDCVDSVRGSLVGLDGGGITRVLRDVVALSRKTQSLMLEVVADTARLLAGMFQLSAAEGNRWRGDRIKRNYETATPWA